MISIQTIETNKQIVIRKFDELKTSKDPTTDLLNIEINLRRLIKDSSHLSGRVSNVQEKKKLQEIEKWAQTMLEKVKLDINRLHKKVA